MKKLHLLILKTFIGPFLITSVFVTFIFVTQKMVIYLEDLANKGIPFSVFAELAFYLSFNAVPRSLPLAILLSSLMTYGNLGQHNELTAIKSSGVSLLRIISPVFVFVLLMSFGLAMFNNFILPKMNLKAYSLLYDLKNKKPALDLKEGVFYSSIPNYSIRVNHKDEDGQGIKDVMIYDHTMGKGNTDVVVADSGRMYTIMNDMYLVLELYNGVKSSEYRTNSKFYEQEFLRSEFDFSKVVFDLSSFQLKETDEDLFKNNRQVMNGPQLFHYADSIFKKEKNERVLLIPGLRSKYRYMPIDTGSYSDYSVVTSAYLVEGEESKNLNNALSQARSIKTYLDNKEKYLFDLRKRAIRFAIEFFHDYTEALACIVMFLIGAPVGVILKKGGLGVPVLVTIIFFILHYVVDLSVEKVARVEGLNFYFAVFVSNLVLLPFGLYFLRQARRDSNLFEADTYRVIVIKIKNIVFNFGSKKKVV